MDRVNTISKLELAALTVFLLLSAHTMCAQVKIGVTEREFTPSGNYEWRGAKTHALVTTIWYPAEKGSQEQERWVGAPGKPFASAGQAALGAPIMSSPAKFPLIVLSHGTGGSSLMMAWLGTELARHGYIAAAVNHPGNNGREEYTLEGFIFWWQRARDLSTVIDLMLKDQQFGTRIDSKRIGAAGFSLGGYTMIEIAGGITQPKKVEELCSSGTKNMSCNDPPEFPHLTSRVEERLKSDPQFKAAFEEGTRSYRDARIRAIYAIAPALGAAFDRASLRNISIPVHIVAGNADPLVPIENNARFFYEGDSRSQAHITFESCPLHIPWNLYRFRQESRAGTL